MSPLSALRPVAPSASPHPSWTSSPRGVADVVAPATTEEPAGSRVRASVDKFGGSSLRDRLPGVLALVAERAPGDGDGRVAIVVVSAIGDTTDHLLAALASAERGALAEATALLDVVAGTARAAAAAVLPGPAQAAAAAAIDDIVAPTRGTLQAVAHLRERAPRAVDEVLAIGERLATLVVGAALKARGVRAVTVDARDWLVTDDVAQAATVDVEAARPRVAAQLPALRGSVVVVAGFVGRSHAGHTTTLGRNGSDYTAAVLADLVGATTVTLWTDVAGVHTADPGLVAEARPVARLTYDEARELAFFGARLFHPRTVAALARSGARLTIRSTRDPDAPGTEIGGAAAADQPACIATLEDKAILSIEAVGARLPRSVVAQALVALEQRGIVPWMTTTTGLGGTWSVVVDERAVPAARQALADLAPGDVRVGAAHGPVTLLTLVAEGMGQRPNVAGRLFSALGRVGIKVRASAQGASERSISCAVDKADTAVAVATVHAAFHLAAEEVQLLLLGRGVVGGALLAQIAQQQALLEREHGVRVVVVGVVDSRGGRCEPRGLPPEAWRTAPLVPGVRAADLLPQLARLSLPVVVDCSAASGMEAVYEAAFAHGAHVVGANKRALALPWDERTRLFAAAQRASRSYRYETTCGAALPVIQTLKDLVRTGDVVEAIEGSLSGTLGFLSAELMRGTPLSAAVRIARERGFTEPHPVDDLSGLDVARKAIVLARELGAALELSDIEVTPFVDLHHPALDLRDPERFLQTLAALDDDVAARVADARARGQVLRYLARVVRHDDGVRVQVGPVFVDAAHPAATLRDEEAMVAFTTARYRRFPLVVRGAGAGGAVTASGVLADVLRLAQGVRGTG
jgi:aspartokinase/homoserine dehydrogenase 1